MKCSVCGQTTQTSFASRMGDPYMGTKAFQIWVGQPSKSMHFTKNGEREDRWVSQIFSTGSCIHSLTVSSSKVCKTPKEAADAAVKEATALYNSNRPLIPVQIRLFP